MFCLLLLTVLISHPVHETLTEVEWNEQSKRFEVALRLHSLDEQWLKAQHSGKRPVEQWAIDYVRRNVRIAPLPKPGTADTTKYSWIGRQADGAHVWWYFEIETPNDRPPEWIEHRVLFERQDNYTNRILILSEKPNRALTLSQRKPRGILKPDSTVPPAS